MRTLCTAILIILGTALPAVADCRADSDAVLARGQLATELLELVDARRVDWATVVVTDATRPAYARLNDALQLVLPALTERLSAQRAAQVPIASCAIGAVAEFTPEQLAVLARSVSASRAMVPLLTEYLVSFDALPD